MASLNDADKALLAAGVLADAHFQNEANEPTAPDQQVARLVAERVMAEQPKVHSPRPEIQVCIICTNLLWDAVDEAASQR